MKHRLKFIPFLILQLSILTTLGFTNANVSAPHPDTITPINHIIVVMQQNHTFDNYFGTYPKANGFPVDTCVPMSLDKSMYDRIYKSCLTPFHIGDYPVSDLSHGVHVFEAEYNQGKMNGFVDALNKRHLDGQLAMGYYDDRDIPYYWNLADQFVLFDNYFTAAHTGSIMNRMFWVSGVPGTESNRIPAGGFSGIPTIFDRLQERGISWKVYINHYDPTLNYRSLTSLDYLPPQVQWMPLLNMDRFLDNPDLFSHIVDLSEYYTDLENGTLPAVSYVLLLRASEHPLSDLALGQRVTRTMIQNLMESDFWDNSAFLITYDDWGGWYDHVPPPQVDKYGYGFRVPTMLISAYARKGYVDHTLLDHTSILKFIEANWSIPPLAERDRNANNFISAFDFSGPPRTPVYISSDRTISTPRGEPRRGVIYLAYGSALFFALLVIFRADTTMRKKADTRLQTSPYPQDRNIP